VINSGKKMKLRPGFSVFLSLFMLIFACNRPAEVRQLPDQQEMRKTLEETNKILLESEKQEIKDFISRYGWEMKETGSGLWYQIYQDGNGAQASAGHIALINYSIRLITGDLVYSSETDGAREFRIGRGGVELGLEEGILFMKEGDRARFIMPSHLAHGVPGDGVKIPARATIVYDVELVKVN
jgi:FKBP-type peptidyl-prolyl cis-trans isomerase FkpA